MYLAGTGSPFPVVIFCNFTANETYFAQKYVREWQESGRLELLMVRDITIAGQPRNRAKCRTHWRKR